MRRDFPCRLLVLLLPIASAGGAEPADFATQSNPAVALGYVREAWGRNLGLAGETLEVDRARARLSELRGQLQPRLDLEARYSRADGGRTIAFPAGDLLNGAYRTLNDYLRTQGQPAAFAPTANQSISLVLSREQETKLRLTQPLYRPELTRGIRASRAGLASRQAQLAAYKRELRLTVLTAYYGYLQAEAAIRVLENAAELTAEALRVNRQLRAADRLTDDRVLRAEADDLAVRQQRAEAERDRNVARNYFNLLLDRDLDRPIVAPDAAELARLTGTLLAGAPPGAESIDRREELTALHSAVAAAAASEDAARAKLYPTLGLAVEGGTQGEDYHIGSGANFFQGSLVAEVNLWDGRQNRSGISQARIDRRRADLELEQTRLQLALQVRRAGDEYSAATASFRAAAARRAALERAFDLVARREREGVANQLNFIDARSERTRAALNEEIVRQRLFTAAAELDRAAALSPLP